MSGCASSANGVIQGAINWVGLLIGFALPSCLSPAKMKGRMHTGEKLDTSASVSAGDQLAGVWRGGSSKPSLCICVTDVSSLLSTPSLCLDHCMERAILFLQSVCLAV